jgi:hypothetical protein
MGVVQKENVCELHVKLTLNTLGRIVVVVSNSSQKRIGQVE